MNLAVSPVVWRHKYHGRRWSHNPKAAPMRKVSACIGTSNRLIFATYRSGFTIAA
jgi:hypothetical protein